MSTKIYIYKFYFPISGKSYIGQTKDLKRRLRKHLKSGYAICNALNKYDDWSLAILHTCKMRDEANRIEIEEIRNHNSVAPDGYNLTRGGEGGDKSDETKRKMSASKLGKQGLKGFKHSKESRIKQQLSYQKNKLAKANKGMTQSINQIVNDIMNKGIKRLITKHQEEVYRCRHHDFEGLTAEETATKLCLSVSTINEVIKRLKTNHPELFPILSQINAKVWGLWYVSGLTHTQIAERMGISEDAVYSRLKFVKKEMGFNKLNITNPHKAISLDTLDIDRIDIKHKF